MDEGTFGMNVRPSDFINDDDDYDGEGALDPATRRVIVVVHYATFVFITFVTYVWHEKSDVIKQRVYSNFLLLLALIWLQLGPAFEIGNHYYVNNWQLYDSISDLINLSFSFFNFGAQNVMALSLRKKGLPIWRCGEDAKDWIVVILDILFVLLIFLQPIVYVTLGRATTVSIFSPIGGIAGIMSFLRLWQNLGPNKYTFWGGLGFLVFPLLGVAALNFYNSTNYEWVHIFIGGSFVASSVPLAIALANAEPPSESGTPDETTPLNV